MSDRNTASTFAKGLSVLACFEGGRRDLTMAQIAQETGFDRATVRRLCLTLETSGYLVKDNRTFHLTAKVVALAGGYLSAEQIGRAIQPVLTEFAEALNGEIAVAVRDGTRAIYIAKSSVGSARLSLGLSVGSTLPLLPTAVGRMLLAQCQGPERDQILREAPLEAYTPSTDLDRSSLMEKVHDAYQRGYAYSAEEFEQGAAGLAVPCQRIGGAETVLATTASINHFTQPETFDKILDTLRRAAINLRP